MQRKFEKNGIIFLQSEGRGHITQAFSLQEILNQQDIGVSAIIIRSTTKKQTIQLLKKRFHCDFIFIESYEFFKGKNGKSVNLIHTALDALLKLPKILISSFKLNKTLKKINFDIIFNFYEPACTYYNFIARKKNMGSSIISGDKLSLKENKDYRKGFIRESISNGVG
jgi:UDP-N-acetylglucosamine:LPS N-acetylglucosamine transferase